MKRIIAIIICIVLIPSFVCAADIYQSEADKLNALGLFKGTEKGYELNRSFTRAEGAVMLTRLLGVEKEALAFQSEKPLSDVDGHWAESYVMYCYDNKITKGTGENTFSPEDIMTGKEYITLILRSLGYENVNPDNAYIAAAEYSLLSSGKLREILDGVFTRNKMVYVSYNALKVKDKEGEALVNRLISQKVLPKSVAEEYNLISNSNEYVTK